MGIEQRINDDYTAAMRSGDEQRKGTLRLMRSELHYAAIAAGRPLNEDEALAVLKAQAKQRRDSIEAYRQGRRPDLVAAEEAELAVIAEYLPPQMSPEEIEQVARARIAEAGAAGPADMGKVMRPLLAEIGDRAPGDQVAAVVRRLLAG